MAAYHLEAKMISWGTGCSAVAASAYLSYSRMLNEYDGVQHDYTRKQGLVWQMVFLLPMVPLEWQDREKPWSAVEETEKTKDSRLAWESVVALSTELLRRQQIAFLQESVREQLVAGGICTNVAIHDTDDHNSHVHILPTVRPLTGAGVWQYKTEKEYLCVKDSEEQGSTAAKLKSVQAEDWERRYQYKADKKGVCMVPPQAEKHGDERTSKYPKSTKYRRQNSTSAHWNSEE